MNRVLNIILLATALIGCQKFEANNMLESLEKRKVKTQKVVEKKDFTLDGLLDAQDYFFDVNEKVHLLQMDEGARKSVQRLIRVEGYEKFCKRFVLPLRYWKTLNKQCQGPRGMYKCSEDLKDYRASLSTLADLVHVDEEDGAARCL